MNLNEIYDIKISKKESFTLSSGLNVFLQYIF